MTKITFVISGLIILLTVLASAENEEQSLSEKTFSIRAVRDADAGRRKKNRNGKKNMKNKRRKNKRKNKKRTNRNKKRTNKGSRAHERMVDGKCLESATTAMSRWRNQVANFMKQKTRIEKQAEIAEKKSGKKAVFGPIAKKLIDVGGGNKSNLSCSGSTDSDGAKQMARCSTGNE